MERPSIPTMHCEPAINRQLQAVDCRVQTCKRPQLRPCVACGPLRALRLSDHRPSGDCRVHLFPQQSSHAASRDASIHDFPSFCNPASQPGNLDPTPPLSITINCKPQCAPMRPSQVAWSRDGCKQLGPLTATCTTASMSSRPEPVQIDGLSEWSSPAYVYPAASVCVGLWLVNWARHPNRGRAQTAVAQLACAFFGMLVLALRSTRHRNDSLARACDPAQVEGWGSEAVSGLGFHQKLDFGGTLTLDRAFLVEPQP